MTNAERERVQGFGRLEEGLRQAGDWYLWDPYVSERQWGTVREDLRARDDITLGPQSIVVLQSDDARRWE